MTEPILSDRFNDALGYAERLHRHQTRKGNAIPYVAHLLAVSAMALESGADEDVAIAALLHDAVEDQGGIETLEEIRGRFGDRVARIVAACSDSTATDPKAKAPWRDRKEAYLAHLAHADLDIARVTAADKLHNSSAILRDLRRHGPETMKRFGSSPAAILWYHAAVAAALAPHRNDAPIDEIEAVCEKIAELLGLDLKAVMASKGNAG